MVSLRELEQGWRDESDKASDGLRVQRRYSEDPSVIPQHKCRSWAWWHVLVTPALERQSARCLASQLHQVKGDTLPQKLEWRGVEEDT